MKHLEDIQINADLELCLYEYTTGFAIDIRNSNGKVLISRYLDKPILGKTFYIRKGYVFTKVTKEELLK